MNSNVSLVRSRSFSNVSQAVKAKEVKDLENDEVSSFEAQANNSSAKANEQTALISGQHVERNIASKCCMWMADLFQKCSCNPVSSCFSSVSQNKYKLATAFVMGVGTGIGIMRAIAASKSSGNPSDNPIGALCEGMNMTVIAGLANQMMSNTTEMVANFINSGGATEITPANVTGCVAERFPALQSFLDLTIQTAMDAVNP